LEVMKSSRILVSVRLPEALRDVLQGIADYVKGHRLRWDIVCVEADELGPRLAEHAADGAITVISPSSAPAIRRMQRAGVPVVNLLHDLHPRLPSVLSDDRALGRTAAAYFLGRGFRRFAFVGVDTAWSHRRQQAFGESLATAGHSVELAPEPCDPAAYRFTGRRAATSFLRQWVKRLPKKVAVFTASDFVARALLPAALAAGRTVPEDLAILGVDNFTVVCELAPVPLSSIGQDFERLGAEAARVLEGLLSGKTAPAKPVLVAPGRLAVRRSTETLAFEDQTVAQVVRLIRSQGVLSVKDLLRQVPLSRKWLDHRFIRAVGHSPSVEIRQTRLAAVRDLLLDTDLPIRVIAQRCHFPCAENLSRAFRSHFGLPPHAYRSQHRAR
jgi:LacI family transcriptional regulator